MARKKLPELEKKVRFQIFVEGKYLINQNKDELRAVAHESIVKYVELTKNKKDV